MMVNLLKKVEMEKELLKVPKTKRPKKGDLITKKLISKNPH